jgi:hypothetical protein
VAGVSRLRRGAIENALLGGNLRPANAARLAQPLVQPSVVLRKGRRGEPQPAR